MDLHAIIHTTSARLVTRQTRQTKKARAMALTLIQVGEGKLTSKPIALQSGDGDRVLGHDAIFILEPRIWCPSEQKSYALFERARKRLEKCKEGFPAILEKFSNRNQRRDHRKKRHNLG